jgi:hypothetical protein
MIAMKNNSYSFNYLIRRFSYQSKSFRFVRLFPHAHAHANKKTYYSSSPLKIISSRLFRTSRLINSSSDVVKSESSDELATKNLSRKELIIEKVFSISEKNQLKSYLKRNHQLRYIIIHLMKKLKISCNPPLDEIAFFQLFDNDVFLNVTQMIEHLQYKYSIPRRTIPKIMVHVPKLFLNVTITDLEDKITYISSRYLLDDRAEIREAIFCNPYLFQHPKDDIIQFTTTLEQDLGLSSHLLYKYILSKDRLIFRLDFERFQSNLIILKNDYNFNMKTFFQKVLKDLRPGLFLYDLNKDLSKRKLFFAKVFNLIDMSIVQKKIEHNRLLLYVPVPVLWRRAKSIQRGCQITTMKTFHDLVHSELFKLFFRFNYIDLIKDEDKMEYQYRKMMYFLTNLKIFEPGNVDYEIEGNKGEVAEMLDTLAKELGIIADGSSRFFQDDSSSNNIIQLDEEAEEDNGVSIAVDSSVETDDAAVSAASNGFDDSWNMVDTNYDGNERKDVLSLLITQRIMKIRVLPLPPVNMMYSSSSFSSSSSSSHSSVKSMLLSHRNNRRLLLSSSCKEGIEDEKLKTIRKYIWDRTTERIGIPYERALHMVKYQVSVEVLKDIFVTLALDPSEARTVLSKLSR